MATAIAVSPSPREYGPYTIDDLEELQSEGDHWPRIELLDGWLLVSPVPSCAHQRVCTRLTVQLEAYGASSRTAWVSSPGGLFIPPKNALLPDLLLIPGRETPAAWEWVSGWPLAVEVLSPSTRKVDLGVKRDKYLGLGIPEVWFVDPINRAVIVARRDVEEDALLTPPASLTWRELTIDLTELFSDD